ncbi:MAG: tetratricopeptide repeat protein [Bacteroidetes bacterium]|nr:tetratricopeptide repeat protein [Bacteroidota bacterium]
MANMKPGSINIILLLIMLSFTAIRAAQIPDSIAVKLSALSKAEQVELLGQLCWNNRVNNTEISIEYGERGLKLATEEELFNKVAQIGNFLGVAYINYNYSIHKALPYFHDALELSLKIKDSVQTAYAYNNLGDVYMFNRNYPLSLEYSLKAAAYFEKLNNQKGISYSYINLGEAYRLQKEYELSLSYLFRSLGIREKLDNMWNIAGVLFDIGVTYAHMNDYEKSLHYYQEAMPYYNNDTDYIGIANCLSGIGEILYEQKNYTQSLEQFAKAIRINIKNNNNNGLVSNYLGCALVYSRTGEVNKGKRYLAKALKLTNQLSFSSRIRDVYEVYSEFHLNTKNYKAAAESFKRFIAVHDSLLSLEREITIKEFQQNHDMNRRLVEIKYDLEKSELGEVYLKFIMVLLLVIGGFLYWRYRTNNILNKKLNLSNEAKDKLFKVISHDLKSPFNSLMAFASLLYKDFDSISPEEHKEGLREIQSSADKVYKLLENLLDWSRIQTNTMEVNLQVLNPREMIIQNCHLYERAAKNKNITLKYNLPDEDCSIMADSHMFSSVMRNLLSNAIKFTPNGGDINVSYNINNEKILFEVNDNGIGIEDEIVNNIFDKDKNLSTNGTNQESGTGLGLLLCHDFVTKMGGDFLVESKKGIGSRFYFTLMRRK